MARHRKYCKSAALKFAPHHFKVYQGAGKFIRYSWRLMTNMSIPSIDEGDCFLFLLFQFYGDLSWIPHCSWHSMHQATRWLVLVAGPHGKSWICSCWCQVLFPTHQGFVEVTGWTVEYNYQDIDSVKNLQVG